MTFERLLTELASQDPDTMIEIKLRSLKGLVDRLVLDAEPAPAPPAPRRTAENHDLVQVVAQRFAGFDPDDRSTPSGMPIVYQHVREAIAAVDFDLFAGLWVPSLARLLLVDHEIPKAADHELLSPHHAVLHQVQDQLGGLGGLL